MDGRVDGCPEAVLGGVLRALDGRLGGLPGGVPRPESAFGFRGQWEFDDAAADAPAPTMAADPKSYLGSAKGSPVDGPA